MNDYGDYTSKPGLTLKPGYFSSLSNAARQFKMFWPVLLLITFVLWVISILINLPSYLDLDFPSILLQFLYLLVIVLLANILHYGYVLATLKAARCEKPSLRDLFRPFHRLISVILAFLLTGLVIGAASFLLIIPGIYLACRFAFVPHLVVDQKKGVLGALNGSWEMTSGHGWRIFFLGATLYLLFFAIILLVFMVALLIFGIIGFVAFGTDLSIWFLLSGSLLIIIILLPINIYYNLVWGSLYHAIKLERDALYGELAYEE